MLLADEEAASEVRLGRACKPRDAGKENPFTWLGCPEEPEKPGGALGTVQYGSVRKV